MDHEKVQRKEAPRDGSHWNKRNSIVPRYVALGVDPSLRLHPVARILGVMPAHVDLIDFSDSTRVAEQPMEQRLDERCTVVRRARDHRIRSQPEDDSFNYIHRAKSLPSIARRR